MAPSFNLATEPWIPCITLDGRYIELSLRDALAQAHKLRELYDPSPLVTMALHRLLLAVLHRVVDGPPNVPAWRELWSAASWEAPAIDAYLGRWHGRFDLFDSDYPFYQVPPMGSDHHPVSRLAQEQASGNNPTLFDHHTSHAPEAISGAEAARRLVTTQAYALGGGVSKPFNLSDGALARGVGVLALGDSLFETLALNLVQYGEHYPDTLGRSVGDLPAWEQDSPEEPNRSGTHPHGYLDYLTWQSRRIHLYPEGNQPLVVHCEIQQRMKLVEGILDPFKPYVRTKERGLQPLRLRADRAMWRDSDALLQWSTQERGRRPGTLGWLAQVLRPGSGQLQGLAVFGLGADQAKALLWRRERLPLPPEYLGDEGLVEALQRALQLADDVSRVVYSAAGRLVREASAERGQQVSPLAAGRGRRAEQGYWAALDAAFGTVFAELPEDRTVIDGEPLYGHVHVWSDWASDLRQAALDAFSSAAQGFDSSGRGLQAVAVAERQLRFGLGDRLGEYLALRA